MRKLLTTLLISICFLGFSQSNQGEYLEAKRQFSQGNYRNAMGAFQSLTNDQVFGAYASFYYALSAYYQQVPQAAIDMWKQILQRYPNWEKKTEVHYWLSKLSFEKKRYLDGVKYADLLPDNLKSEVMEDAKRNLDFKEIDGLYAANEENELLAILYFQALANQPYEQRDHKALLELSKKFDFDVASLLTDMPVVKKDSYSVALVLPFMFDSLQNPQSVIRNTLIFELYQGMLLAQDTLRKEGVSLELYPYDTKKAGYRARSIVRDGLLDDADLIIGPLFAEPNEAITALSVEKEIPMINPLSSNGGIVKQNRLGYLFMPSYETQGRIAGEYARTKYSENKNAMILFERSRDEVVAEAYKKVLEADSFNVVLYDQIDSETALEIQSIFTEEVEEVLDSLSQEEIDSILLLPEGMVLSRPQRDEETGEPIEDEEGEFVPEYFEMKYTVREDTIGHIFAATSNSLLANNIISLVDVRKDTIGLIGYDDWLNFKAVPYSQLERLEVAMIHTSFFDEERAMPVKELVRKTFWTEPSEYHLLGYELIQQVGHMFAEHGKYFQRGLLTGEERPGYVMQGLTFGSYKDNQVVPIVRVEDLQLKIQKQEGEPDGDTEE